MNLWKNNPIPQVKSITTNAILIIIELFLKIERNNHQINCNGYSDSIKNAFLAEIMH